MRNTNTDTDTANTQVSDKIGSAKISECVDVFKAQTLRPLVEIIGSQHHNVTDLHPVFVRAKVQLPRACGNVTLNETLLRARWEQTRGPTISQDLQLTGLELFIPRNKVK